jgi:hypothetical protein
MEIGENVEERTSGNIKISVDVHVSVEVQLIPGDHVIGVVHVLE